MRDGLDIEREEMNRYYFALLGYSTFKEVYSKLNELLKFYRIESEGKMLSREIVYDASDNLLTDAGIVLSKKTEEGKTFFNVMKISMLPGELKRMNENHVLKNIPSSQEPKDTSLEITTAIEGLFKRSFSFDLDSIIKLTSPFMEIDVESENYKIIGGTGLRSYLSYEKITYRDIKTNRKEFGEGVVLRLPKDPYYENENKKILNLIERHIQILWPINMSKFELGKSMLYPKDEDADTDFTPTEE